MNAIRSTEELAAVEMMCLLGLSKTTTEKIVKGLKEKNKIKHEGPRKGGRWMVIE